MLTVPHDGIGGPKQITITGQADGAFTSVSPLKIKFRKTPVGQRSAPLPIAVVPIENGAVRVLTVTATGDFQVQNHCANPIQSRCEFSVVFSPQRARLRTGSISITTDASNPRQTVSLSGRGISGGECKRDDHHHKGVDCDDDD